MFSWFDDSNNHMQMYITMKMKLIWLCYGYRKWEGKFLLEIHQLNFHIPSDLLAWYKSDFQAK